MFYKSILNVVAVVVAVMAVMFVGCDWVGGDDKCGNFIQTDEHGNLIDGPCGNPADSTK